MTALVQAFSAIGRCILKGAKSVMRGVIIALAFLWSKFAKYCTNHNFRPKKVLCILLALIVLAVGAGFVSSWIERQTALTSGLGLVNIGELATQAYHYRAVDTIKKSQEIWGWEVPLTEAESIFSYEGIIKVGYDFEKIEIDVDYDRKRITVTLPEPFIMSNDILSDSLLVYSEDTNIFTPMSIEDFNETQADMKLQGEDDAAKVGIYDSARMNAETLIKGFLSGTFNLEEFEVVFE